MERRRLTREIKLEAVRLIRDRGVSYAQARPGGASDGIAQLGEVPRRRCPGRTPRKRSDEARAAGDRAAQARGGQAEGGAGHSKKAAAYFAKESTRSSVS